MGVSNLNFELHVCFPNTLVFSNSPIIKIIRSWQRLWKYYQWLISDFIPKKSEKFKFRKNFVTIIFHCQNWPRKGIFDIFCPRNFRKWKMENFEKKIFCNQFLTQKNMVTKCFRNLNFANFLGIKSEINHWPVLSKNCSF